MRQGPFWSIVVGGEGWGRKRERMSQENWVKSDGHWRCRMDFMMLPRPSFGSFVPRWRLLGNDWRWHCHNSRPQSSLRCNLGTFFTSVLWVVSSYVEGRDEENAISNRGEALLVEYVKAHQRTCELRCALCYQIVRWGNQIDVDQGWFLRDSSSILGREEMKRCKVGYIKDPLLNLTSSKRWNLFHCLRSRLTSVDLFRLNVEGSFGCQPHIHLKFFHATTNTRWQEN